MIHTTDTSHNPRDTYYTYIREMIDQKEDYKNEWELVAGNKP